MVALPQVYKTADVKTSMSSSVHVKDGWHVGVILSSEMAKSPFGSDQKDGIMLKVIITAGEDKDTILEHFLGIFDERPFKADNPTWTYSKAAYGTLGQIADALKMEEFGNTEQFHNKRLAFETATRKGKDKDTGAHKPEWDASYIKGYREAPANGVVQQFAPQQEAGRPAAQQAAVTAPSTNPFAA